MTDTTRAESRLAFPLAAGVLVLSALLAAQTPASSSATSSGSRATAGTAVVIGTVVDAYSGSPVTEAVVSVLDPNSTSARTGAPAPVQLLTGSDGRFVIHGLPAGTLALRGAAPGYLDGAPGQARPDGVSTPIRIEDGAVITDVRIRLWKLAAIAGTVTDESGEPAVDTSVRILRRRMVDGQPSYEQTATAKTDDRGMYRVGTLSPGTYAIALPQSLTAVPATMLDGLVSAAMTGQGLGSLMDLASSGIGFGPGRRMGDLSVSSTSTVPPPPSPGGEQFMYETLFYPAATSLATASLVTLGSGEERTGVDFALRLIPTIRVSGTVTSGAKPAAGLPVRLTPEADDALGLGEPGLLAAAGVTLPDGTFTLVGVPAGQYVIRVERRTRPPIPPEFASNPLVAQMFAGAPGQAPGGLYASASISVGTEDVTGLALDLGRGSTVSGRVVFSGTSAQPTDADLKSLSIGLTSAHGDAAPAVSPVKLTAANEFTMADCPPGAYYLTVSSPKAPWRVEWAMKDGRDLLVDPIDLANADVSDVVVTLSDRSSALSGTVHVVNGETPPPTRVLVFPADIGGWIANGMSSRRTHQASVPQGTFDFEGLAAGEYFVAAIDDSQSPDAEDATFYQALSRVATRVTLGENDHRTVALQIIKGPVTP